MYVLFEYNKIYEKGKREGAIEKLERVKTKINACTAQGEGEFCDNYNCAIKTAIRVIDSELSELKGE